MGPAAGALPEGLFGFVVFGLTFAVPLLVHVMAHDAVATKLRVQGHAGDAKWYDVVVIVVGLASLFGVGALLIGSSAKGSEQIIDALIGLATVVVAWLCVHTVYVLRYARIYYSSAVPPIDFKQKEDPQFSDFAYFAFNNGMAFQVSDTDLKTSQIRRVVLGQCLLAYLYGTIILAASINLVAGIGGQSH